MPAEKSQKNREIRKTKVYLQNALLTNPELSPAYWKDGVFFVSTVTYGELHFFEGEPIYGKAGTA